MWEKKKNKKTQRILQVSVAVHSELITIMS